MSKERANVNLLASNRVTTTEPRQLCRLSQVLPKNELAASRKFETRSYRRHTFPSHRYFAEKRELEFSDRHLGVCEKPFVCAQGSRAEQSTLGRYLYPKYPSIDTFAAPKCFSEGGLYLCNLLDYSSSYGPRDQGHSRSLRSEDSFPCSRNANAMITHPELPTTGDANWIRERKTGRLPASNVSRPRQMICESNSRRKSYLSQENMISMLRPGGTLPLDHWQRYFHPSSAMWDSNFRTLPQRPCGNNRLSLETIVEETLSSQNTAKSSTTTSSTTSSSMKPISQILKNSNAPTNAKRTQNCPYLLMGTWLLVILTYSLLYCCGVPATSIGLLPQAYTFLVSMSNHYRSSDHYVSAHLPDIEETHHCERVVLEQGLQSPKDTTGDYMGDGASQTTSWHDENWRDRIDRILGWKPIS